MIPSLGVSVKGSAMTVSFVLRVLLVLFSSSSSHAQPMYRCGTTFSQVPCDKSASSIPVPSHSKQAATQNQPRLQGRDLCTVAIPSRLSLKDPYSAVISVVNDKPRFTTIEYANTPMVAKEYILSVNAKNSYGAYVGAKPYFCYLNEPESNVLAISESQLGAR